jgi:hypothetical protein
LISAQKKQFSIHHSSYPKVLSLGIPSINGASLIIKGQLLEHYQGVVMLLLFGCLIVLMLVLKLVPLHS